MPPKEFDSSLKQLTEDILDVIRRDRNRHKYGK